MAAARMRWRDGLLFTVLLVGLCAPAAAFDGKRKGFLIGFGLGPSDHLTHESISVTTSVEVLGGDTVLVHFPPEAQFSDVGASIQFQVGYGFSNRFQVYYCELNDLEYFNNYRSAGFRTVNALSSLSVDWTLGNQSRPWFLTGGVGRIAHPLFSDESNFGSFVGVGRDLGRLSQVRLLSSFGSPMEGPAFGATRSISTFSLALVLGLLWR